MRVAVKQSDRFAKNQTDEDQLPPDQGQHSHDRFAHEDLERVARVRIPAVATARDSPAISAKPEPNTIAAIFRFAESWRPDGRLLIGTVRYQDNNHTVRSPSPIKVLQY